MATAQKEGAIQTRSSFSLLAGFIDEWAEILRNWKVQVWAKEPVSP